VTDGPDMVLRLTHLLAQRRRTEPLPLRLCHAVVEAVEASDGAISLGTSTSDLTVLCATSPEAARFEEAQHLVREGPTLDACRTGLAVPCSSRTDLVVRWPGLGEVVADLSLGGTVHVLPMRSGVAALGALTVHHDEWVGSDDRLRGLQFFADAVGAAIVGDLPDERVTTAAGSAAGPMWSERDQVSQATGMVVAQLDIDPPDALAVLRAHAFAQSTTLVVIARRVVERELDFGRRVDGAP
jgi:hypothetical protein